MSSQPKLRLLCTAFCWIAVVPPLFIVCLATFLNSASDHSRRVALFVVFCASAATQVVGLFKLQQCRTWSFGVPKFASYLLTASAFLLLLMFGSVAIIAGYYLIHPDAPPIFSCC